MAFQFDGRVAVVTGAASGIGAALAAEFAKAGCRLALIDRDEAGLRRVAATVGGGKVSIHPLDVSDRAGVAELPEAVLAEHGRVDILVNNAGIAAMGRFDELSLEKFDTVMAINFGAVVAITKAFLPHISRDGRIANMSSMFGLVAPPGQIPYVASKFAVRGFTEALRLELAATGIKVTCVHPGGVRTAIARTAIVADSIPDDRAGEAKAEFGKLLRLSPEVAARKIVAAIRAGRARLLIGADAWMGDRLARMFPSAYGPMMMLSMGRMKKHIGTMDRPVAGAGR